MSTTASKVPPTDLFEGFAFDPAPARPEMVAAAAENGATMSEIAPGVWVVGMPEFEVPSHVLCRLVPGETPGTYTLAPEPFPGYVRVTEDIGRRMGVMGLSITTLRRLMWSGYVDYIRPAPHCLYISIESLLEHFKRTRADGSRGSSGFWEPRRIADWRTCIDMGSESPDGI